MSMVDSQIRRRGVTDQEVLEAMERVPRHEFVPHDLKAQAYTDRPLPIGYGQTISQPYIVALMTELLEQRRDACRDRHRVRLPGCHLGRNRRRGLYH